MGKPLGCKFGKHEWEDVSPTYATRDGFGTKQKCMKCGEVRTFKEEPRKE